MLAIRMQRTGRKGHAMFRLVVQDSRVTPTSGKVVVTLGSYDPHAKVATIDKEKAAFYLGNGAQPSDRAARLLQTEGVELPKWVKVADAAKKRAIRNPEKLRKNQPKEEAPVEAEAPAEAPAEEKTEE
ncbi:MAG TPA: 30S ribosomal protein S16 [Candidatus Saccharimonadales bacterium]|nr:30S ribosomal protein S16 [Candidatus Saccharimonadales bacterium]